jgi:hypothetical protein
MVTFWKTKSVLLRNLVQNYNKVERPIQWVPGAVSQGIKQPEREADHSPVSSAEVKNGGAKLPLPYMSSWHGA